MRLYLRRTFKRILLLIVTTGIIALAALAFRPKPVTVETARAAMGPLQVSVDEDAETRAHDRFTVAAPVAGRLSRIAFHEGDQVGPDTVIASISPLPLDARELAETRALVRSSEALRREAEELIARAHTEHEQARRDLGRTRELARHEIVSQQALEDAERREASTAREFEAARFKAEAARAEVTRAQAGLVSLEAQRDRSGRIIEIRAPSPCRILRILEKSERVVATGAPLLVLSNPNKLEVVIDLLSTDAVKVKPGGAVMIENWGGPPIRARVRTVEPYGFTKISALGVEEQRVNVIADFIDPPSPLGDGYRVDARVVLWEDPNVLKVPASALFRTSANWSVFVVEGGRARRRAVDVGQRNATEAQIRNGVRDGEQVILHPANDLKDGARVASTDDVKLGTQS